MASTYLTHHAANACHLDRPRGTLSLSKGTECEWRDPEDECGTMLTIQGVRPRDCPLKRISRQQLIGRAAWREHLVSVWQRTHPRDLSTPLRSPSTSSGSLRVGRDDRH